MFDVFVLDHESLQIIALRKKNLAVFFKFDYNLKVWDNVARGGLIQQVGELTPTLQWN